MHHVSFVCISDDLLVVKSRILMDGFVINFGMLPILLLAIALLSRCRSSMPRAFLVGLTLALLTITKSTYPDFSNYNNYYNGVHNGLITLSNSFEPPGWWAICKFFSLFGLSYHGVVFILILISCFLLFVTYKILNIPDRIFWIIYLFVPGVINCVQVKYACALIVLFVSVLPYLKAVRGGTAIFIIGLLISCSIHSSMAVYAILLLVNPLEKASGKSRIVSLAIMMAVAISCLIFLPTFAKLLVPNSRYERYFGQSAEIPSLLWICRIGFGYILILSTAFFHHKYFLATSPDENTLKFNDRIMICLVLLSTLLPLLLIEESMHRLFELSILLCALKVNLKAGDKNFKFNRPFKLLCGLAFFLAFLNYTPLRTVVCVLLTFEGMQPLLL